MFALFSALCNIILLHAEDTCAEVPGFSISGPVKSFAYESGLIERLDEPVKLVETPLPNTNAFNLWGFEAEQIEYFSTHMPLINDCMKPLDDSKTKSFLYQDYTKPTFNHDRRSYDRVTVNTSEFLSNLNQRRTYCAFSTNDLPNNLQQDVDDHWAVIDSRREQTQFWIGPAGTISQPHYDPSDNIFCQIHGEKVVLLFPPEALEHFLPYPENSVHDRQATIFTQDRTSGISAYLKRGDCLFIPAFWFHRVESLTPSLSINFWSYSPVYQSVKTLGGKSVPSYLFQNLSAMVFWIYLLLTSIYESQGELVLKLLKWIPLRYESAGYCTNEEFFPERCPQINNLDPEVERDIRVSLQTFVMEMKQHRGKSGLDLVVVSAVEKVVALMMQNSEQNMCLFFRCLIHWISA